MDVADDLSVSNNFWEGRSLFLDPANYSILDVSVAEGIATIWLKGRDEEHQYLADDQAEFARLGHDLTNADDVRVAVLTARGGVFSSGITRTRVPSDGNDRLASDHRVAIDLMTTWINLPKPVVVVLNGVALHGALTLAMLGDIVIAERRTRLRDVHTILGLVSATGPFLWPLSMGLLKAKRYVLTGDWLSAEDAERCGLVSEVVENGAGFERGMEYAQQLAALDPFAVAHTKHALNQWLRLGQSTVHDLALAVEFFGLAGPNRVDPPDNYRVPPS